MLDEFSSSKPESRAAAQPNGPGRPQPVPAPEGISDDEFAKQLQAGMTDLLGELETSPEMQAQFESMMKEFGGAAALGGPADPFSQAVPSSSNADISKSATKSKDTDVEKTFQETIKQTMKRMQASGDQATAAAASENTDDILAEMMKAMQAGGLDGEGGEEDFSKMLLGMMEQLTNKDILYEPMKELDDKFPEWMEKNAGMVKEEDMMRYKEQQVYVREIVGRFEEKTYKDENAADREYIVERMQKVGFHSFTSCEPLLKSARCKQQVLRPQTSLEIWQLLKKLLGHLRKVVHNNETSPTSNIDEAYHDPSLGAYTHDDQIPNPFHNLTHEQNAHTNMNIVWGKPITLIGTQIQPNMICAPTTLKAMAQVTSSYP